VVEEGGARIAEQGRKLRPGVRRAHVDNADGLDAWARRLGAEQGRGLATLHAAPEFLFRRQKKVLIEWIGGYLDLDPFAAAGDDRKHCASGVGDPHIVLDLGHVLLGRRLFRERPGQHEFGLENRPTARDQPVYGCPHPAQHGMPQPMLDAFDGLPGVALVPMPVERFSHQPELDDEVAGQVLRL
jgi:hypothetical protein